MACKTHYREEIGGRCVAFHCGHPTAIWPYGLTVDGSLVAAPNGRAYQYKHDVRAAAFAVEAGALVAWYRPGLPCGEYPAVLIRPDDRGPEWRQEHSDRAWRVVESFRK